MLSRQHTKRAARGVTLIELMVALVILGLVLFVAMPGVGAWIRNTQVRNTASSMLSGLAQARNEAVRRNAPVRFSLVSLTNAALLDDTCALSGSGVSWIASVRDPAGHCSYAPSTNPVTDAADANNPLIVASNAGGVGGRNVVVAAKVADGSAAADTVTFNGFGRVVDAAPIGFINVNNDTAGNDYRSLRIEITAGGSARLCDMALSDSTDSRYCPTRGIP
jgi:type IV fimbrial biogenesis protein FimT